MWAKLSVWRPQALTSASPSLRSLFSPLPLLFHFLSTLSLCSPSPYPLNLSSGYARVGFPASSLVPLLPSFQEWLRRPNVSLIKPGTPTTRTRIAVSLSSSFPLLALVSLIPGADASTHHVVETCHSPHHPTLHRVCSLAPVRPLHPDCEGHPPSEP